MIKCNGYHIPPGNVFAARLGGSSCVLDLTCGADRQLVFEIPGEELQPALEQAGFVSFGSLWINPAAVSYLRQGDTYIVIYGGSNWFHVEGQENVAKALEIFYHRKKAR